MSFNQLGIAAVFALSLGLISCGDDKEKTTSHTETEVTKSTTTTVAPSDENSASTSAKTEEVPVQSMPKDEVVDVPAVPAEEPMTDMPATDSSKDHSAQ